MNAEQQLNPTLLSAERAKGMIAQTSFTASEKKLIDRLTKSVSAAAQAYCRRTFALREYDELHHATHRPALALRNPPLRQVQRIAYNPSPALTVRNTAAGTVRATVQVTLEGLKAQRWTAAGPFTETALALAEHTTIGELATSISALSNGWAGTALSPYGDWPSSDLRALQGSFGCKQGPATLQLHGLDLDDYDTDDDAGLVYRNRAFGWGDERGQGPAWPGGRNEYRVIYTAGFAEIPADVQQACAEWIADLFWAGQERPVQVGELLPTGHVRLLLDPYRRHNL